jgi:hypothetical protein
MPRPKQRPRMCVICHREYQPTRTAQRACGFHCARALTGRTTRGRVPAGLLEVLRKRKAERKRLIERACEKRWPELSVREIEIFNYAVQLGYRRCYQKGNQEVRRRYQRTHALPVSTQKAETAA